MIETGKTYVVMGLLDQDSIAFAIGQNIEKHGGKVIYTVQNERMKRLFFDRSKKLSQEAKDAVTVDFCDITIEEEVEAVFSRIGPVAGVIHSIAFVNPKTCLGEEYHTSAFDDLKIGFHISVVSLATVARYAVPQMPDGGAIACLTFSSHISWPYYNWMSVNKAALEANVRGLARRHGRDNVRVNAVTTRQSAESIPGFNELSSTWSRISPIRWNPAEDKGAVADAVTFLVGPHSAKITGQTIHVDGGASSTGGALLDHEVAGG